MEPSSALLALASGTSLAMAIPQAWRAARRTTAGIAPASELVRLVGNAHLLAYALVSASPEYALFVASVLVTSLLVATIAFAAYGMILSDPVIVAPAVVLGPASIVIVVRVTAHRRRVAVAACG